MNNEAKVQILQKNWLFSQLSPQEIDEILLKTTTVEYRRKETIFKKGEFISSFFRQTYISPKSCCVY